jgi:hypothetical protein
MSDSYSEVSYRGLGDNLVDSIKGVLVGIVLFVVSFPVLWWNEGRTDMSNVAKKAVVVKADGSEKASGEGKLIAVTSELKPEGTLSDPDFVKPGPYVSLRREVEMYAWVETVTKKEEKKLGGGTKVTKTYTYDKKWTSHPEDSSEFHVPEGHENPPLTVRGQSWSADKAYVGAYSFAASSVQLPPARPLSLDSSKLVGTRGRKDGEYVFIGRGGGVTDPRLGDVRIAWRAVEGGRKVTLYGQGSGTEVVAYMYKGEAKLHRVVDGTHEEAIATLKSEHNMITWILRIVGFLMMWFGLALVLGPINAVLDIIPFLGSAGRALTGIALFPIALVLTGLTIIVSIVAHSPILLVIVIAVFAGAAGFWIKTRSAKKKAAAAGGAK